MRGAATALILAALPAWAAAQDGAEAFASRCAVCHGASGVGQPGFAPPLDRAVFWEEMGAEAPRYVAGVVLAGLSGPITAAGQRYAGLAMPPMPGLDDAEIAAIGTYVLATLGGVSRTLDAGTVASVRADPPGHGDLLDIRPEG